MAKLKDLREFLENSQIAIGDFGGPVLGFPLRLAMHGYRRWKGWLANQAACGSSLQIVVGGSFGPVELKDFGDWTFASLPKFRST